MTVMIAAIVAVLFGTGVYMILQRTLTRIVLGMALLSHGANLLLLAVGGASGTAPFIGAFGVDDRVTDPVPQALALTAIVISFAMTAFLLALAFRSWRLTRNDEVEDDLEDRRIARLARMGLLGEEDEGDSEDTDR
ncbi:MAG: Na(+)/H(+) antiporter subunit C [Acidimicrobiia bacterium]|nr:Na(+)/H(+) antiporter subunit C [Acidimicrobiia bacterium]